LLETAAVFATVVLLSLAGASFVVVTLVLLVPLLVLALLLLPVSLLVCAEDVSERSRC
jgi:hypothetical protein